MSGPTQRAERVIARCRELARITDTPGETTRLFLSPATREAHRLLTQWMNHAALAVQTDAIGNLRGLLAGPTPNAPRLLIGSHIDTVPNAGAFDGPLGVLLGLALIEELRRAGTTLPYAIELIAFSEEEGVRFAKPFLGSLALIGELPPETLNQTDADGISIAEAIQAFGLDPTALPVATANPTTAAYLEFHIEQGPVLESQSLSLAVVDLIVGQTRAILTFTGHPNHAGTTPMGSLRRDALAAAAEWITEVERYASATPGLVATVGKVEMPGAAVNVVPGLATVTLDIRHANDAVRQTAAEHLLPFAQQSAVKRRVQLHHTTALDQPAVPMDAQLTDRLASAIAKTTTKTAPRMTSGAGHDAMILARRFPSAMLFLRSPAGLSHHPEESVLPEDVETALAAVICFLQTLQF